MEENVQYSGPWYVVEVSTHKPLESHNTEWSANRACLILNDHNGRNGHATRYLVQYRGVRGEQV